MESTPSDRPADAPPSPARPAATGAESRPPSELEAIAQQEANIPLWKDFLYFLVQNKKWWLVPLVVVLLLLGFVMALSSTAIAPFIYTVF